MSEKLGVEIRFDERGLVPAVIQESGTGEVLMLAYMNAASLQKSLETGHTHFWSRSRQALWKKGETSGHVQKITAISYDCDADTLLVVVEQTGPACHTGQKSCFFRALPGSPGAGEGAGEILGRLEALIEDRRRNPKAGSYTNRLLSDGDLAREKVLEESREVTQASGEGDKKQIVYEAADLVYHLLVLLASHCIRFGEVKSELAGRYGAPPKKG